MGAHNDENSLLDSEQREGGPWSVIRYAGRDGDSQ